MNQLASFFIFSILQSLFIVGVKELFNDGMILYKLRVVIDKNVSEFWRKPLYSCVRCMSGLYGAITFWPVVIYQYGFMIEEIPVFVFNIGVLVYLNYFFYKKQ